MGCTYCEAASLWASLVWATWLAECYLTDTCVAPADLIFTRTMFFKFSMLYCYLTLCLNLVLLVWKNTLISVAIYLIILRMSDVGAHGRQLWLIFKI